MKISTKINLLTTAWMIGILIVANIVIFVSFMKFTVSMEEIVLVQRAKDIIDELNTYGTQSNTRDILKDNLTSHTLIRMIRPDGSIEEQVTNDRHLTGLKGKFSKKPQVEQRVIRIRQGEKQVLIVRRPIIINKNVVGTIEISERLLGLELRKDMLIFILTITTILAGLLALLGGRWLANTIMRPIAEMIGTMEKIERSGVPQKIAIPADKKDELQKMAATFNRMIERLQTNMEKQKQFISDASHELKTPLTIIKSYASLLRRRGTSNKEIADEAITAIDSEASRIQKMTDTLLALATLENEVVLEKNVIDLAKLSMEMVRNFTNVYKREITLKVSDPPVIFEADEEKIKQLLIIFLDNALKYSANKIEMEVEKNENSIRIVIKDYGIGIPAHELANIFERFYRVDKARSRSTGGTGLGLSIAQSIVKLHKGEINVTSTEGKGTTVELRFPL
ncbi:ATP-binding protein [Neobacillus sp. SM06]|uniref:sensor histidine kinase n=1 Tax=Neobacillus sp. SM06 TaxID=3422492 RepID=UPI003D26609A